MILFSVLFPFTIISCMVSFRSGCITEAPSWTYNLCGKIDLFDTEKGLLTERKKHIETIYDGYVFQLYAQCFCLREMGYTVKSLRFYSSDDNKVYPVALPEENKEMLEKFKATNKAMQSFLPASFEPKNEDKCRHCIYNDFCDRPLAPKAYCGGF